MTKTNFTKVEEALVDGLRQLTVAKLHIEAQEANGTLSPSITALKQEQTLTLTFLKRELTIFAKKDPALFERLGSSPNEIINLLKVEPPLTDKVWESLKSLKDKVLAYRDVLQKAKGDNDSLVEGERAKHINKRFNVNDKWLPLT